VPVRWDLLGPRVPEQAHWGLPARGPVPEKQAQVRGLERWGPQRVPGPPEVRPPERARSGPPEAPAERWDQPAVVPVPPGPRVPPRLRAVRAAQVAPDRRRPWWKEGQW
jgi:hypothetical protein